MYYVIFEDQPTADGPRERCLSSKSWTDAKEATEYAKTIATTRNAVVVTALQGREYADLTEAAKDVLMIQDAVNSRAIIRVFPNVMKAIEKYDPQQSTDAYNSHPLVVMMLDKLVQLSGGFVSSEGSADQFGKAYRYVLHLVTSD